MREVGRTFPEETEGVVSPCGELTVWRTNYSTGRVESGELRLAGAG